MQEPFYIIFVEPVLIHIEERSEFVLSFTEPGLGGPYTHITWSKDGTVWNDYRIVLLKPLVNNGHPLYVNEYCSGPMACDMSSRVQLNTDTGELTIYNTSLTDTGDCFILQYCICIYF